MDVELFEKFPDCFSMLLAKARKGDKQAREKLLKFKVLSEEELDKLIFIINSTGEEMKGCLNNEMYNY